MHPRSKFILNVLIILVAVCIILFCTRTTKYSPSRMLPARMFPFSLDSTSGGSFLPFSLSREISKGKTTSENDGTQIDDDGKKGDKVDNDDEKHREEGKKVKVDESKKKIENEGKGIERNEENTIIEEKGDEKKEENPGITVKDDKDKEEKGGNAENVVENDKSKEEKGENVDQIVKEGKAKNEKEKTKAEKGQDEVEIEVIKNRKVLEMKEKVEANDLNSRKLKNIKPVPGKNAPTEDDLKFGFCQKRRYKEGLPFTAIASRPGSGNTWLRYLIEQVTGVYTTSLYCDRVLRKGGFHGECLGRSSEGRNITVGFKIHAARRIEQYDKCVLLIRNPLKAAAAEFQRQEHKNHTGISILENIEDRAITGFLKGWLGFHMGWLNFSKPQLVLFYDELKLNLQQQLVRMCDFFQVKCSKKLLDCIIAHNEGNFRRPPHDESHIYTKEHVKMAKQYQQDVLAKVRERFPEIHIEKLVL